MAIGRAPSPNTPPERKQGRQDRNTGGEGNIVYLWGEVDVLRISIR